MSYDDKPTPEVQAHAVTCGPPENPPSEVAAGRMVIHVRIKLYGQGTEHHAFALPIDLRKLRDGELESVPVVGMGRQCEDWTFD